MVKMFSFQLMAISRALRKFLFEISDTKINELEIPTGNPLLIEFDKNLK